MFSRARELIDRVESHVEARPRLTESDMTMRHGTIVWKAQEFVGQPHFYPVYRYEDYYSYSILALILKKRRFVLDSRVPSIVDGRQFDFLPADLCIDREISRIGGPNRCGYEIDDVADFATQICRAMVDDVSVVENANPLHTNVVLCGGKDSLNLLLLPWRNETIAASAEPNYPHVVRFVQQNDLPMRVVLLEDKFDQSELNDEILECCCRAELTHWRWGAALRDLAGEFSGKVVYWKGQHGDLYMSPTWKAYTSKLVGPQRIFRRIYKKGSLYLPHSLSRAIGERLQPQAIDTAWFRGASLQGSHMGFIREIANCLTLSAYHGPAVTEILGRTNLAAVAQHDMRPLVGRMLLGRDVIYPTANPAPGPSSIRRGLSRSSRFLALIGQLGIEVRM